MAVGFFVRNTIPILTRGSARSFPRSLPFISLSSDWVTHGLFFLPRRALNQYGSFFHESRGMRGDSCLAAPQRSAPRHPKLYRRAPEPCVLAPFLRSVYLALSSSPALLGFFRPGLLRHTRTKPTVILTNLFTFSRLAGRTINVAKRPTV